MHHIYYFAYGERQFASTATGVLFGLLTAFLLCVLLIAYASRTYPADRR